MKEAYKCAFSQQFFCKVLETEELLPGSRRSIQALNLVGKLPVRLQTSESVA